MRGYTLTSQWGRDSSFQSGSKRGIGVAGVIAIVFALALGAAGGYAAAYFTQPDNSTALDAARAETAELDRALLVARQELADARAGQTSSAAQVDQLEADIARMAADLDAMAEKLAASSSPDKTREDGTSAAVQAMSAERDRLAAENQDLKSELSALEAERDALGKSANAEQQRLEAELARLEDEILPQLTADRDRLQQKVTMMLTDQATLKTRIKQASDALASDAGVIADLEGRLAETERELKASQAALAALERTASRTAEDKDPAPVADSGEGELNARSEQDAGPATSPRDPDSVAAALRSAPGLETLSEEDRRRLAERLVSGECVTTALESVFERIPILTLRNLIRDLNSDC